MCLGCFRLLEEICGWNQSSDTERESILKHCQERALRYQQLQAERLAKNRERF